jgi:hypothetical protein
VVIASTAVVAVLAFGSPSRALETDPVAYASAHVGRSQGSALQRLSRSVGNAGFSLEVPTSWERFDGFRITKSTAGPQDAEAVLFWTGVRGSASVQRCANARIGYPRDPAVRLVSVMAKAEGTKLLEGPSRVTVDGRHGQHLVLKVRKAVGCDPAFFYTWKAGLGGAFWRESRVGDTIEVWTFNVHGVRVVFEAETSWDSGSHARREIRQIVDSIRFD